MKIYTAAFPSQKEILQEWLVGTIQDPDCAIITHDLPRDLSRTHQATALRKTRFILDALKRNTGDIIIYSDAAVQFFQPIQKEIEKSLQGADIAFLKDDPNGVPSAGFFAARCTDDVIALWGNIEKLLQTTSLSWKHNLLGHAVHAAIRSEKNIRWTLLPHTFFGGGTLTGRMWSPVDNLYVPSDIIMHHSSWTQGNRNKNIQLKRVQYMVQAQWYADRQNTTEHQAVLSVPAYLQPKTYPTPYPVHQKSPDIEQAFFHYWCKNVDQKTRDSIHRTYIPVFWTYVYEQKNSKQKRQMLQRWLLENLDPEKQYWTIIKQADGILEDLPENVLVYSAGGQGDIPIPLLCDFLPHHKTKRDILASFVGVVHISANNKTGTRTKMYNALKDKEGIQMIEAQNDITLFQEMLARSIFTLCPRGYGKTSFRFYEALHSGSIPIYIYDTPWLPYEDELNWDKYCIRVHENDIETIPNILASMSEADITEMQNNIADMTPKYCTMPQVCAYIVENLLGKRGPEEFIRHNEYSTYRYSVIAK